MMDIMPLCHSELVEESQSCQYQREKVMDAATSIPFCGMTAPDCFHVT